MVRAVFGVCIPEGFDELLVVLVLFVVAVVLVVVDVVVVDGGVV